MIKIKAPRRYFDVDGSLVFSALPAYKGTHYSTEISYIRVHAPNNRGDLYKILHELGHIQDETIKPKSLCTDEEIIQFEINAWRYAITCIKEKYKEDLIKYAIPRLQTYNKYCREPHTEEQLVNLLR